MAQPTSVDDVLNANMSNMPSNNKRGTYKINTTNVDDARLGFFHRATGINASHSNFTDKSSITNVTYVSLPEEITNILTTLKPVDRTGYCPIPCMDGTRNHIFDMIDKWLDNMEEPNILWLSGIPGAGKSAIASSIVSRLTERKRMGSSFFFRRGDVRLSDPAALWRTVAYDLAKCDPNFTNFLIQALMEGRVSLERPDVTLHFKYLIEEPLTKCYSHSPSPVVVIDALDECDSDNSRESQRDALLHTLTEWSHLPKMFKLIVTGRDDRVPKSFHTVCKHMVLPTGISVSAEANKDIRRFFEVSFNKLPESVFSEFPKTRILDYLTSRAAGLFIWADTVMKVLKQGLPEDQLRLILDGRLGDGDDLTKLYTRILEISFQDIKDSRAFEVAKLTISTIVLAKVPFHRKELHLFLPERESSVEFVLNRLSSVITIGEDELVRIGHLSFGEFLCDRNRCPEPFFIDRDKRSHDIAMACFHHMKEGLKFNICDLETSYLLNYEVEDLPERIKKKISGPLVYSCMYWVGHLRDVQEGRGALLEELKDFFYHRFLFWLEVMSLIEQILAVKVALVTVTPWIEEFDIPLSLFVRDARRFVINFDIPISQSAPHIYLSALPFSPSESLIMQQYQSHFPNTLFVSSGRSESWPAVDIVFRGHDNRVESVAFSPDSMQVVSGSHDGSILIWNVETGQITGGPFKVTDDECLPAKSVAFSPDGKRVISCAYQTIWLWNVENDQAAALPFEGHTGYVNSVAFSPDGKRIVSGSDDRTILVWNVETCHVAALPFEGHTGRVNSVTFSPDGKRVASGSFDATIRIWDVETGLVASRPFEGHNHSVTSVAFSPDGKLVVSGSYDRTVRIWDVETGRVVSGPFNGHTDSVASVMFSPGGKRVVSGSYDRTILIWDVDTGQIAMGPFENYAGSVYSVAISPDGKRVVSGSRDCNIWIWDMEIGPVTAAPSKGRTSRVNSVAFSPDGKRVVSGYFDKTIRIWDVETGHVTAGPLKGHTHWIKSVAFSPDGKRVASGSFDSTILIWDMETGKATTYPFKGHTDLVASVAFSPDGKRVVSGSYDRTVRIWDVETGYVTAGPFEGHATPVIYVAFSLDGKRVVSRSRDRIVRIWNAECGHGTECSFQGNSDLVAFSLDDKQVGLRFDDGLTMVLDVESGQIIKSPFQGHTHWVHPAVFSPDGKRVVSGLFDGTIHIWDAEMLFAWTKRRVDIMRYIDNGRFLRPGSGWSYAPIAEKKDCLLFWVPPFSRVGFHGVATIVVLGTPHITRVDFSRFKHGRSWTQCYSPANVSRKGSTEVQSLQSLAIEPLFRLPALNNDSSADSNVRRPLLHEIGIPPDEGTEDEEVASGTSRHAQLVYMARFLLSISSIYRLLFFCLTFFVVTTGFYIFTAFGNI